MKRVHYIAAEMFGYSYDNYYEKVEMGHIRFTKYMPDNVRMMEKAEKEQWSDVRLAKQLEVEIGKLVEFKSAYADAVRIVDADNSANAYIEGIKQSLKNAIEAGLESEADFNQLVSQILYRTADLSLLLREEEKELWEYSQIFRDWEE